MSENPVLVLRDVDDRLRAIQHEITKVRREALHLAKQTKQPDLNALRLIRRLDHMMALADVPGVARYRQEQAALKPPVEPPGQPDDLRCKLCGEEKEPHEFFFDDGQGRYGFTGRCTRCRSLSKRERHKIADQRGLARFSQDRRRVVGKEVGK